MNRLLAAHTRYFKNSVVASIISIGALQCAWGFDLSELVKNKQKADVDLSQFENKYSVEAKAAVNNLLRDLKDQNTSQLPKVEQDQYGDAKFLVFISKSMGESYLKQLFNEYADNPDVLFVFRGIDEGESLANGILRIHNMIKTGTPNVVINPVLYKEHAIEVVPTIVKVSERGEYKKEKRTVIAHVEGTTSVEWVKRNSKNPNTFKKRVGPIEKIIEPDLIEVAKNKVLEIDWEEKKNQAMAGFWGKQDYLDLPRAAKSIKREIDPTVVITADIRTPDGNYVRRKGDRVNPLEIRDFSQAIFVFDATDKKQVAIVKEQLGFVKAKNKYKKVTLISTSFDKERGWDFYREITDSFDLPVFKLTPDVMKTFQLGAVPSLITASNKRFVINEFEVK